MKNKSFKKNRFNKIIIIAIIVIFAFLISGSIIFFISKTNSSKDIVYGQKIENIISLNTSTDRYSGIVDSENIENIKKDSDRKIESIFVTTGQSVDIGTELFKYEDSQIQDQIAMSNLEIEELTNEINVLASSATDVESQLNLSQKRLELSQKNIEIEKLRKQVEDSVVKSSIKGIVKIINETSMYNEDASDDTIMSISESDNFRIKGTISEQEIMNISLEQPVIIRSRTDELKTWKGIITLIDNEPETNLQNDTSEENTENSASKYNFYVKLDSADELMLGQHVYIETDTNQDNIKTDGLWLDPGFIAYEENSGKAYVWASKNKRLIKKYVELGELDEDNYMVEIKDGLKTTDIITWPDDTLKEGMKVTEESEGK